MNKKIWCVYKHTLIAEGEHKGWSYIGITRTTLKERWKDGKGYIKQSLFYNAIQKYGWNNFSHEILEENILTKECAEEREKYWINYYHTWIRDPECRGYNLLPGGDIVDNPRYKITKDNEYLLVRESDLEYFLNLGWKLLTKKEVREAYYEQHKEKLLAKYREYGKGYRAEHKEELAEKNKQYALDNKEKVKAKQLEWTQANKEHIAEYKRQWWEKNKESEKAKSKTYYEKHREEIIERSKAYAKANKEKIAAYKKEYQKRNKDKLREYKKEYKKKKQEEKR